jgi:transposase-like protein
MEGKQRRLTAEEKVRVMKRHLVDKVPVSALCEEHGFQPTQFYQWQKQFFENGAAAFERQSPKRERREAERIEALEAKLRRKDEVLSELLEEHVALKKSLGEI